VSEARKPSGARRETGEPEDVLRAKYLDYCSAQVADLLLLLSPDEIYRLAEEAHRRRGGTGTLTYQDMVRLATERISSRLVLPPFEVWADDYRRAPQRYEAYLLGLWEREVDREPDA